jgi:hypothetical protein
MTPNPAPPPTTTQRTFYYSPSTATKVTRDALHLLLAFEIEQRTENGRPLWVPAGFKLVSLHNLQVKLKIEYNQGNRSLYDPEGILAEGRFD